MHLGIRRLCSGDVSVICHRKYWFPLASFRRGLRSRSGTQGKLRVDTLQPFAPRICAQEHVKAFKVPKEPWTYYRYSSLPDERLNIRLLELQPGIDELRCKLHTVHSAKNETPYAALSYTWGPQILQRYIWCDDCIFPVTQNLYDALKQIRTTTSSVYLWIDAICINQANIRERGHQVNLMQQIFIQARQVIAWIGREQPYTREAFSLIEKLATLDPVLNRDIYNFKFWARSSLEKYGLPPLTDTHWSALLTLLQAPYFSRVWIVQELVVNPKTTIHCGNHQVSWSKIEKSAKMILTVKFRLAWNDLNTLLRTSWHEPVFVKTIAQIRRSFKILHNGPGMPLATLLWITRRFQSTDPRDKVLALIGLSKNAPPLPLTSLQCDSVSVHCKRDDSQGALELPDHPYAISAGCLYTWISGSLLQNATDLSLLSMVEDISLRSPKMFALPSWVPDFSAWHGVMKFGFPLHMHPFNACGEHSTPHVGWDKRVPHRIRIAGRKISEVENVLGAALNLSSHLPETIIDLLKKCERFLRSSPGGLDIFWRTICGDRLGSLSPAPEIHGTYCAAYLYQLANKGYEVPTLELWEALLKKLPSTTTLDFAATRFINTTEAFASQRRLCLTRDGALGLGPQSMQVSDCIIILNGGRVPIVMRQSVQGWIIVGEAFVWGMMRGEARGHQDVFDIY